MPTQTGYYDENGVWHETGQDPGSSGGDGGSSGGDPGGGGDSPFDFNSPINSYAQQHQGYSFHGIMQEGEVTYRDGVPGIMVKYDTPMGTSTEWTPIPGWNGGSNVPMNAYSGGGSGGGGAATLNNPYYNQLQSMLNAQGAAQAADLRNSIQQALIGFGLVPENFTDKFGALDDLTRSLIEQNTQSGISTYARLLESKQMGIKNLMNRLNARGLRRSGARGFGLRKNQLGADRNLADALQGLMQYINSGYAQYTQGEYQRQMQLLMAAMQYASGSYGSTTGSNPGSSSPSGGSPSQGYVPTGGTVTDYSGSNQAPGYGTTWPGWTPM